MLRLIEYKVNITDPFDRASRYYNWNLVRISVSDK